MLNYKKLAKFLGFKIGTLIILLIAVSIISFTLVEISPIDPVRMNIGEMSVSQDKLADLNEYWGVNKSLPLKVVNWIDNLAHGNLGTSLIYRIPVSEVISERFSASFILMFLSWVFSGILGFFLGVLAGFKKGTFIDKGVKIYSYIIYSAPVFWIALILLIVFAAQLRWFPTGLAVPIGKLAGNVTLGEWLHRLILPVLTLSITGIAQIALFTRSKLVEVSSSDYFLFAKARGEKGWSLIKRHGIRNILLPAITLQFLSFSELFGGTILVEQIFSYPGIGQAAVTAGLQSDVPLLLGIVLISTIFVFCGNSLADLIYKFVDPRIRESEANEL
ncbi:MAG: ABC transporter permease [Methanobrevibacter sp.]|nr:ABC transporter permease [Candidatus Methanovirga meridionalis]